MEKHSRIRDTLRHIVATSFRAIRGVFRLAGFLLRLPGLSLRHALLSNRTGMASILVAILVLAGVVQACLRYSPVVMAAVCIGIVVLQILLFRAFLWVYRPEVRIKSFVFLAAAIGVIVAVFRLVEFGLSKVKHRASDGHSLPEDPGTGMDETDTETQLKEIRIVLRLGRGIWRLIPQTRGQLFPVLMASWLALTTVAILLFAICFYSLARIGLPVLEFSGGSGCLWCNLAASLAVFTTAPISNVSLTSAWGLFICGVEVADALLLLGLFLALLMRLVPHDSARGLEKIETAVKEMNEKVETRLELAFKEFGTGVTRGGTDSPTQHEPPS